MKELWLLFTYQVDEDEERNDTAAGAVYDGEEGSGLP